MEDLLKTENGTMANSTLLDRKGRTYTPAVSPRHGPIGLAILRKDAAAPGTEVSVAGPGGAIAGTVDVLSIDDPAKERPRS